MTLFCISSLKEMGPQSQKNELIKKSICKAPIFP